MTHLSTMRTVQQITIIICSAALQAIVQCSAHPIPLTFPHTHSPTSCAHKYTHAWIQLIEMTDSAMAAAVRYASLVEVGVTSLTK